VLTDPSGGGQFYIAKYNPDGALAWVKSTVGTGMAIGWGIASLSGGAVVVTGYFQIESIFGQGEENETVLTSTNSDIFIAKYNGDGTLAWAKSAEGNGVDSSYDIDVFLDGSAAVVGDFEDEVTFGIDEANETTLVSSGENDIFIARYNSDGTLAWAKSANGDGTDLGESVACALNGSSLVSGSFTGKTVFGKGEPNETELTAQSVDFDVFVARYNPDGTLAWAKRAGGGTTVRSGGIDLFETSSAIVTGSYENPITFGLGEPNETVLDFPMPGDMRADIFVARFKP
jgi:hypothetical protein